MDETTPLTNATGIPFQGPIYVFPGGVSPRARRLRMKQFQWCMAVTFVAIIVIALSLALALSGIYGDGSDPRLAGWFLATNSTPTPENSTAIRAALAGVRTPIPDEPEEEWALRYAHAKRQHADEHAISAGIKALGDRELLEESIQPTPVNSPAFRHYRSLNTNPEARKLARRGYVENHATMDIAVCLNYTKGEGRTNIGKGPRIVLPEPVAWHFTCDFNARYRRPNGVCNNKREPRWYGAAMVPYRRMVAPDYADGIAAPRDSHDGKGHLPPAREISLKIHRSYYETDSNFTVMLAVFGQFLDHDITATSLTTLQEGESIDCCAAALHQHPECFPVRILPDDPYYRQYGLTCMNFVRSAPAPTGHYGPRQQLNQATAFIDGSVVYGNLENRQRHLRNYVNGTLRMYITEDRRELLPISSDPDDGCNRVYMSRQGKYCFESGDDRANENLLLTSMHLLWARQHNYLARGLSALNPMWDDEYVFQESRKILAAQIAHITYNEFLPILLGRELAAQKGLLPATDDLDAKDRYDPDVDATIANCFAASAFRFAHTLLPGLFNATSDNSTPEHIELHKMLFNPFSLWMEQGIDRALLTAANTAVMRVDRFFSLEVTQKLFEGTSEDKLPICGLDLVSLNIQRGRDHGIPAYSVFRRHCNLPPVDTWEQMAQALDIKTLKSIMEIYNSPQDVDLYTGALSEPPLEGAIFGPTLTCLVSDQFLRLKIGDSHWYERKVGPQRFTKAQLAVIYGTTLSEIICRNSDSIKRIRKHVMERRQDDTNMYLNCLEIGEFNFSPWSESAKPQLLHRAGVSQPASHVRVIKPPKLVTSMEVLANVTLINELHDEA